MSLSFGIRYIVRFDNMRSMYRWVEVCRNSVLSQFPTHLSCIGSSKDGDGHILERLGPARATRRLASVVGARLHRCNVLRLAHRRRWRDVSTPRSSARASGSRAN
jgi:hypothetical protein